MCKVTQPLPNYESFLAKQLKLGVFILGLGHQHISSVLRVLLQGSEFVYVNSRNSSRISVQSVVIGAVIVPYRIRIASSLKISVVELSCKEV